MKVIMMSLVFLVLKSNVYAAQGNFFDELDPTSPDIEKTLNELDTDYESTTLRSPYLATSPLLSLLPDCYRNSCMIWADVDKSAQLLYLYINGALTYTWKVSTGKEGYETPDMDTHPNGKIYTSYTSSKYPNGDYNGLGNMPYAVFIKGGYAIHGTTEGNWNKLGKPASHGCIRVHPDNGKIFNQLVTQNGIENVWITIM